VTQVAVIGSDTHLEEALRAAGLKTSRVMGLGDLLRAPRAPEVLVVDVRGQGQLPAGLAAFTKQHAGTRVVLVSATLESQLMLEAMRAGVNECVQEPITPQSLEQAVRRVLADSRPDAVGDIVAFVGAKGGVGTTTVAVNTATALARVADGGVLLIDLHLGLGDAGLFLGAEPRFSVIDALENVHRVDESFFRGLVEQTKARVDLLGSTDRRSSAPVEPKRLRALLDFAVRRYRYTVLDVARSDMSMLDALDSASTVVVITNQELSALRNAGRLMHALRTRHGAARVKAVVNRLDKRAEIAYADVERVIGGSVTHIIPSDYRTALHALTTGRPVVLEQSPLASSLRKLANDLGGIVKETSERPRGVLGRLTLRRA
jgi:pilus assembly protein CpaE